MSHEPAYHSDFAEIYDEFMQDAPYEQWYGYLKGIVPNLENCVAADLGCGTGQLTRKLASTCRRTLGIDLSEEMLSRAMNLSTQQHLHVEWLCQDMRSLRLPSLADLVVSTSDSLNYLLTKSDLFQTFNRVFENLESGGWFYFDLIGVRRLQALEEGFSYDLREQAAILFESEVSKEGRIAYDVHAFVSAGNSLYRRIIEHHEQQYFEPEVVVDGLTKAGFEQVGLTGDFGQTELEVAHRYIVRAKRP